MTLQPLMLRRLPSPRESGYPAQLIEHGLLADGRALLIRPIKAQDEPLERVFLQGLSERTRYMRLLSPRKLLPGELHRLTHIDYRHEMALVALLGAPGGRHMVGVARYVLDTDGQGCEFAIVIADELQGEGLGQRLLASLMSAAQNAGLLRMHGITLATNTGMLGLARRLGFQSKMEPGDATVLRLQLELAQRGDGWFEL